MLDNRSRLRLSSASTCHLVSSESRALSLNVPIFEISLSSPGQPLGSLVSRVPPDSQPCSAPTGLPSTTCILYDSSTAPALVDLPLSRPLTDYPLSSQSTRTENPETYFTAVFGRGEEKRVKRLVRVVEGFSKAKELSDESYKNFGTRWTQIFKSESEAGSISKVGFEAEVANRLCQLKQARQNIGGKDWEAGRAWLISLAHEVEHISQWKDIQLYTSRGVDRVSAAMSVAEKYLETVKADYKRSRNIVQILKEGGPAALLQSGDTPSST